MASGSSCISDEEFRRTVIGICLDKVITPTLRKAVDLKLQSLYNALSESPTEINKQVSEKHLETLPSSRLRLQYANINGNNVQESPSAYNYAVKDHVSLATLLVQESMAKFTGFDDTMDLSTLLTIMCEVPSYVNSGAAVHAKNVQNEWADGNVSKWTNKKFNGTIQDMQCLVRNIDLTAEEVKKKAYDDLERWKNKGIV